MPSKIRITMGNIEVDYEGSEEFLKDDLIKLLASLSSLSNASSMTHVGGNPAEADANLAHGRTAIEGTTATIAAKLNVKTGQELLVAACAHLTFVKGQEALKRIDILNAAKSATSYYSQSISNNLTKYLDALVKQGTLIERTKDTYALQAGARNALRQQITSGAFLEDRSKTIGIALVADGDNASA